MPSVPLSALQSRDLSAGAKAGVSVGTIVGSIVVMLCLWPFIARCIRRRRRRHAAHEQPQVAEPSSVEAQPVAEVQHDPAERRMSSDSYGLGPDGRPMRRESTKDLTFGSFDGTDGLTTQLPLTSVSAVASGPAPASPSAPPQIDTNLAQLVASSEERRGYSGSYYDTGIPTEAFGGTPWIDKRAPRSSQTRSSSKFTASSLLESILRRATTQKSTSAPSSTHPGDTITALGFSESPTELEPPPNALSRSSRSSTSSRSSWSSEEGGRALDLGEIDFPPASPPPAPPAQPPPGTVNPMEVMGATTTKEQTWRTNAELMNLSASPSSHSTGPSQSPDGVVNGDSMAGLSSQSPEESNPQPLTPGPYLAMDHDGGDDQPHGQASAPTKPIPKVLVKDNATFSTTHLDAAAPPHNQMPQHRAPQYPSSTDIYYTDNSTHSTPFPVPSPSGVSTLNTPDTRISDSTTPSPLPVTPETRQGFSPNSGLSPSPHTPQILVCDRCNQKFDQPHKLK